MSFRDEHKRVHDIAKLLSGMPSLGDGRYRYVPGKQEDGSFYWWAELRDSEGRSIHLSIDAKKDRLQVSGGWPRDSKRQVYTPRDLRMQESGEYPDITVGASRTMLDIAKEIDRRFLPKYEHFWGLCMERVRQSDDYELRKGQLKARLEAVAPALGLKFGHGQDNSRAHVSMGKTASVYGNLDVESSDSLRLELRSLSEKQATALLRTLAEVCQPDPTKGGD